MEICNPIALPKLFVKDTKMTPQATELTVIIKNSESTYRQKFLCYEAYELQPYNPFIMACIEDAKANFKGEAEEIRVKASMEL